MGTNWTNAQQNAIESRNGTLLVSAAAGSGKTAVLVERIIGRILDEKNPISIDRLLAVTFTNAAAGEMRERISKALSKQIFLNPGNNNLKRQQMLVPSAKICTIDSFCMDLVYENFHKLGIGQDYKILESSQENAIKHDAIQHVVEYFYDLDENSDFLTLIELLSNSKNDRSVEECIEKLYIYINAHPFPISWLNLVIENYRLFVPIEETEWGKIIISEIQSCLSFCKAMIAEAEKVSENDEEVHDKFQNVLAEDAEKIESMKSCKTWDEYSKFILSYSAGRNPSARGEFTTNPFKIRVANIREKVKKSINELKSYICANEADHLSDLKLLRPVVKVLCQAVEMYSNELMKRKKDINSFSFSDITHFALQLLVEEDGEGYKPTEFAKEIRHSFDEILLDEYQDTNKAQDMLFESISTGENLFMVGDVKQSIYRFRQAMPQIFMSKKDKFAKYDGKTYPAQIVFGKNFRSRKEVCDFINFTFENLMSREVGEIEYNADEKLSAGAEYSFEVEKPVQMHFLNFPIKAAETDEVEAEYIAKLVKEKIESHELVFDKELGSRAIEYRDIAVLLRSANKHIPNYLKVFQDHGIPVSSVTDADFFNCPEISTMMSLLNIINNPMQDVPLLSVMLSPIYGFTVDEISMMKIAQSEASHGKSSQLYSCVANYAKDGDKKTTDFFNSLSKMRTYCATMPTGALIRKIYDETSYVAIAKSMGDPEFREGNLNLLLKYADNFEKTGSRGLSSFVRFLNKASTSEKTLSGAKISNSDLNSVRFMSIHRSKGLEFPVCIIAGNGRAYGNKTDNNILLSQELGIGLRGMDKSGLYKYDTIPFLALKLLGRKADMSEVLRVQYVAMTRAKEQLIMVSTVPKLEAEVVSLADKITENSIMPYAVSNVSSDAQLLIYVALLHKDGEKLRKMTDKDITPKKSDFGLDIRIVDEIDNTSIEDEKVVDETYDKEIEKEISEKLSYQYPYKDLANLAAKRNASSLDENEFDFSFFATSRPAFMENEGLTPAQKGTAMHTFMQHCDYSKSKKDVKSEAARIVELGFLPKSQEDALDFEKLNAFFRSPLAERIFASDRIMREIKFATFVDASSIYSEAKGTNEKVYIQGIADCVFVENGKLVVVDYKTDHVKSEKQLLDRYKNQLKLYCQALEKTYEMPVSECLLYSFYLSKSLSYDLI